MYIRMIKSVFLSYLLTFISFILLSLLLTFTNFSDSLMPSIILTISVFCILIGAASCSKKAQSNGWLWGGIVGIIYSFVLYLVSSLLFTGFSLNLQTFYLFLSSMLFGAVGGIIGINFKAKN